MLRRFLSYYQGLLERAPYATNFLTSAALGSVGDVICQKLVEKKKEINWRRNMALSVFCAFYQGGVCTVVYNGYSRYFTAAKGYTPFKASAACSAIDNFIHVPIFYMPTFYYVVGSLQGQSRGEIWTDFSEQYVGSCLACQFVWIPLQLINFAIVPPNMRVLFVNAGCLLWNVILDSLMHSEKALTEAALEKAETMQREKTPWQREKTPWVTRSATTRVAEKDSAAQLLKEEI